MRDQINQIKNKGGILFLAILLGVIAFISYLFIDQARAWGSYLLGVYYWLGISLSALIFLAFLNLSKAGWAVVFKRIPEAMAAALPYLAVFLLPLIFGMHTLYHWTHTEAVSHDHLLQMKSAFLNIPFFAVRTLLFVGAWIYFIRKILGHSRAQDQDGDIQHTHLNVKFSALFMVVFGLSFTFFSFDWIMSLEPHWFSTIFGVYNFAGLFQAGLAAIIIAVIFFKRTDSFQNKIKADHLHDLAKLLFGDLFGDFNGALGGLILNDFAPGL